MEIETKTASLETFSVTIRALHVNGKQMTLAVFRQLPVQEEKPDDEKWGTVRYTIKDTGDLWLVYSSEGHLFRRALDPVANIGRDHVWIEQYTQWIAERDKELAKPLVHIYVSGVAKTRELKEKQRDEWAKSLRLHEAHIKHEVIRSARDRKIIDALPQLFIAV